MESLIQLGLKLGVQVVAQGIESPEQLAALIRLGCELGQGPLLSPALQPLQAQMLAEQGCWKLPPQI
jgi:EAL domain-containing protein (putative c-di-GMP-specific phosphodiesterase class I)